MNFYCLTDRCLYQLNVYEDSIWIGKSIIDLKLPGSDITSLENVLSTLDSILEMIEPSNIVITGHINEREVTLKYSKGRVGVRSHGNYIGSDIKSFIRDQFKK